MGSLVMVHDGSFIPDKDKEVCAAAVYLYCTNTNNRCKGERLKEADNYWAGISQRRSSPYRTVNIERDNAGVVSHENTSKQGLKEKQVHVDTYSTASSNSFLTTDSQYNIIGSVLTRMTFRSGTISR